MELLLCKLNAGIHRRGDWRDYRLWCLAIYLKVSIRLVLAG